ncbi:MAG: hypothetical protein CSB47_08950 [Proteobacteria bacterium]|nr:MAG: hypothetical protein CSB47_08950 [Pseudomonadota bacterium]
MNNIITKQFPNILLTLSVATFAAGCSTQQSASTSGSQLVGQQRHKDCRNDKTMPGCQPANKVVQQKRDPLRLLEEEPTPAVMRKTVISANKPTTPAIKPAPTLGVVTSEPKLPKKATQPAVKPVPQPAVTRPHVAPIPTPAASKITATPQAKPAVKHKQTTRRLTLNGGTNFRTASSTLNRAGKRKLATLARTLNSPNTKVTRLLIEGYTDSVGAADFNQVLSLKRANAVADYLATQGLVRSSMETVGHGENSPIADNKTKAGRALNRRVEITATGTRQTRR